MAGSFLNSQYREVRPARAEQLIDGRKRLTRFVSFKQNCEFPAEMGGVVATSTDASSNWSSPPSGWSDLYLISAQTDTSLSPNGSGNNPVTILTYETAGTIAQTDETRNNGALLIRTIRTAHTAPATPAGYTLISTVDDNPSGFDTFTYTFVKGDGEISRDISYSQSSDAGTTGVTRTTIRYIVAGEGTVMPTSLAGSVLIGQEYADQDGYRIWTTTWAKGAGEVSSSVETKNNGELIIYRKTALGTAPTAPTATTGGTVVLISEGSRDGDGVILYERVWAEGNGEISRSIDYRQSDDAGTTGVTVTTIRHLTASSVGTDPTTPPASSVKIGEDKSDQDGYRVWTVAYAKGTGLVVDDYTIRSLGKMYLYRRVALGSAPSAPTGNLDGAVTLFDVSVRKDSGYSVYEYRWVEVDIDGQTSLSTTMRPDGSLVYVVTELNDSADTPAYPGLGTAYLVDLDQRAQDGHYVNVATYIKPPATVTLKKMRQVRMPGEVEFETITGGHNLLITSESNRLLKCDVEVSYNTSQLTDTPWKLDYGTTYRASYTRTGQTVAEYEQKVMSFYVASSDTVTGTDDTYNGVACSAYSATITASSPTSLPTGATVLDVDHDVYLTAIDGTVVYRRTKVSYTF